MADPPDILIASFELPDMDGLELTGLANSCVPGVRVALIAERHHESHAAKCLRAGARGFLQAAASESELLDCVHALSAGRSYVSGRLASCLVPAVEHEMPTPRELKILSFLAQGLSNKLIARKLSIAETTVKSHVKRVMGKLEAASRGQAAAVALRRGLISLDSS
jgi:two-component system NarL family response regulator